MPRGPAIIAARACLSNVQVAEFWEFRETLYSMIDSPTQVYPPPGGVPKRVHPRMPISGFWAVFLPAGVSCLSSPDALSRHSEGPQGCLVAI